MIYIFDKTQAVIKVLTNDDFTAAHLNFKINTATTFEFSLPASKALPSGSKYVATPHPLNGSKFIMLRLTERVDNTETIDYSAYELAYQELATDGYIEDKRPAETDAKTLMQIALNGTNWELNNVNVAGTTKTNFYYTDHLSAISNVVDLLGGEIVFYIEIQGNAISGRYMDYLARQGADTSKVFASGLNLLTVERQSDTSNIYTAILPRGKGEEIDNGEVDTPDGYGRRINIADVEWKKSSGKPLDKPKGSIVLSDPDATAEWGQINGNARLLLQTYDDIDDVNVLINSAYKTLQSVNHPQIQYSATVADVGGLSLGDTVLIMHGDRDLSYKTRVFEVKYDLLSPDQTELSLGDDLSSNSITSQINNLNTVADTTSSQTQWTINQIGRPSTTFGNTEPANPKVGDVFFKELPDGGTEIYRWNGDIWELLASPTTADDIATAVNDAVAQANAHTATAIEQNNAYQQVVMKNVAKSQADLAIKDGDFNNKAQAMADKALSDAKANTTTVAQETLNSANQNLADAKKSLTDSIASEASARNQAVAAVDSQAQGYVNQAKSDIDDTINALSVGGRNYLLNSNGSTLSSWTPVSGWQVVSDSTRGNVFSFTPTVTWTGSSTNSISQSRTDFTTGGNVTVSFWAKASVDGAKFHSEPTGGNATENSLFNTTLTTAWKRYSYTFVLKTNRVYFMPVDAGTIYYLDDLQLETGNMMSDYKQAPEDVVLDYTTKDEKIKTTISQYQETNDGKVSKAQTDATTALGLVETKVSLTVYNQQTGELSQKINDTKDTADSSAQTIADIQEADGKRDSRISEVENTANGLKSTVSDLSTEQGKQSGDISTLQQRADGFDATVTKVDNLSIGGRNYFLNSSGSSLDKWINNSNLWSITTDSIKGNVFTSNPTVAWTSGAQNALYQGGLDALNGQQVTVSFWAKADKANANFHSEPNGGAVKFNPKLTTSWAKYSYTIPNLAATTVYFIPVDVGTNYYLDNLKIESGNTATDWTPAPEDVDSATAKAQLTADKASLAIGKLTSADGIITKAQADIRANADAITKTVSKTVYDQNTGDLNQAISKAQSTADGAVSTVGNYQTSNDKRVEEAESKIKQNSNDITARVIKTDYDAFTGSYKSKMSDIDLAFDRITSTVSENQTSINDLQQVNLLKNTEFNPDYASWVPNDNSGSVFIDNFWKHGSSNNIGLVRNNGATNWLHVVQNIPLTKNQVISFSVLGKVNTIYDGAIYLHVRAYDQTNKSLGDLYKVTQSQTNDFQTFKSENMTLPDGTVYVQVALGMYKNASVAFSQPILVIGDKVGSYVVGAYSDSEKISAQQITIDGITNIVSDPATGLSTRVQKAEGTLSTVKSTADGAMSKASQTANDITKEIRDRNDGDSNTLQSAKDFTQSTISNYDSGLQSQITQTNSSLLATVSANNLIVDSSLNDSSFSNSLVNWSLGGNGKFYYSSGVAYKGVQSIGYNQSGLNGDYSWIDSYKWSNYSFAGTKLNISVDISVASMGGTSTDYLIIYLLELDESGNETARTNVTGTINSANGIWTNYRKSITVNSSSKYFLLRYQMRGNGNVYIARPYVGVQELVAGGYTAGTNNNNKTILSLFKDNWSIGISDNIGNITSGIVGNSSSMSLISKNITLDGNTTVTGDFYAKGGNFKNLNASNLTVGTLNGNQVNITNVNAANITGEITNFIKSNWDSAYANVTIDPDKISLESYSGSDLVTQLDIGNLGIVIKMPGVNSFLDSTVINANGISFQHGGGSYATVGVMDAGFTLEHNQLGGSPMSIRIGDGGTPNGGTNSANDMAFAISAAQDNGTAPQLIWAGSRVGKVSSQYRTWNNPQGFIVADNIKFSTWDNTASKVEIDDTVNFYNYAPIQVNGMRFSDGTTRSLHLGGKDFSTGAKWFGFLDGGDQAGFGTDNTHDVIFFMGGQTYSLYTMLGKLGMR